MCRHREDLKGLTVSELDDPSELGDYMLEPVEVKCFRNVLSVIQGVGVLVIEHRTGVW